MNIGDIVRRADELIATGEQVLATRRKSEYSDAVDAGAMKGFRVSVLSFIDRVFGQTHPHFGEFNKGTDNSYYADAVRGVAIIRAIRSEVAGGWLITMKGLVASELFADFLEMAEHLHLSGYKDPAAVMAGSVLEEHLRQLCLRNDIFVYEEKHEKRVAKKADRLNAELAGANIYSKLDQKLVTAWLDIRNNAAHGKYDQYTADQVSHLMLGVAEFMVRVPVS